MFAERSVAKRGRILRSPGRAGAKEDLNFLPTWVEIRLDFLKQNLNAVRRQIPSPKTEILAVVKADAYGHGMRQVAAALSEEGVSFFGVANIEEAAELRTICPSARILVLGSFHKCQIPLYREFEIIPTVSCPEDVRMLARALRKPSRSFAVHVKIDTGMGRLGVWHVDSKELFRALSKEKNIFVQGIYTHFSSADKNDRSDTLRQLSRFNAALESARSMGIQPKYLHAANCLGLLRFKQSHFNLVRPGILLYGLNPDPSKKLPKAIRPILSWKARVSFLKQIPAGRTVSYGATYKASKRTCIATLPVGYSHGYRVGLSAKSKVIAHGLRCPVAGRVTMDQTMVDVGTASGIKRWDTVILIGSDKKAAVAAEELAKLLETIPYEIVCSIHSRVPRIYIGS